MGIKRYPVTPEIVKKVKKAIDNPKYANLTSADIGALCGTSATSVGRIKNGYYDHLLEKEATLWDAVKNHSNGTAVTLDGSDDLITDLKLARDLISKILERLENGN